jgi:hypothetical protein
MMDFERVVDLLSGLTILRFFPADPGGRLEISKMVAEMCSSEEEVAWLVTRTRNVCNEWLGPLVLRQIFCSRYKPRDGQVVHSSEAFPDGIPPMTPQPDGFAQLEQWKREHRHELAAPAAEDDAEEEPESKRPNVVTMPVNPAPTKPVSPKPTNPNYKRITQADIDQALKEYREKKLLEAAKAELLPSKPDVA